MSETTFQTFYKHLNKAQKQAVDAIDGPVMVIAGPGTGKTHILSLRIANILLQTDTPANGILAITYTNSGVKAIRDRLKKIIGDRAHEVRIHTFHSFASSIIAEYPDHFLHMVDVKQMSDIEQESLVRSILLDHKFRDIRPPAKPDAYVMGIMKGIDEAKRDALTPEMVRQYARDQIELIKNDESSLSTRGATKGQLKAEARDQIEKCEKTLLFADVYEIYETKKAEAKKNDYNDLIVELLTALRSNELLLRLLQERYLYIHIDEHQDTNDAQNLIIQLIAEFFDTPNLFIVGDEKQAIYRFQGASVENFFSLKKKWPAMKEIALDVNYRSHQSILDASFSMIEHNYEGDEHKNLRIKLSSGGDEEAKPVDVVTAENISAMELYMVNELKQIIDGTVAIIVRRNRDLDRVIRLLETHGVPVSSERSVDIFSHPIGRIFFDLVEYLADPSQIDALARTVAAGMWNLSSEDSMELVRDLKSGRLETLNEKLPTLKKILREMQSDGALDFLIQSAKDSSFEAIIARNPSYVHVWRGIIVLAESLIRESGSTNPGDIIKAMLAYRLSAETRLVKVSVGAPDARITAMTAHGSKGLEFDRVFIPYATEESWVGKNRGGSFVLPKKLVQDHEIHDIRRFFYVAITRARKHAVILTALEESDGKELSPLRFITELDDKSVAKVSLPRVEIEEVHADSVRPNEYSQALLDLAQKVIHNDGLSVTALNHYLDCPNKFLFSSVLRLPQAPNISSEKGNAMHLALARVWTKQVKKSVEIEAIIIEAIKEHFAGSYLSTHDKEIAVRELIEDAPLVAKALEPHFIVGSSAIFAETWVETMLEIPIHGKIDALIDTGNEVLVFDYKTKQVMSVNAIKGLTKTDNGDYFRQLIFYKILVSSDTRWKFKKVTPALVFVSPDEKGRCPIVSIPIESEDIETVKKHIHDLVEDVDNGTILTRTCDDPKCEWCGLRELMK